MYKSKYFDTLVLTFGFLVSKMAPKCERWPQNFNFQGPLYSVTAFNIAVICLTCIHVTGVILIFAMTKNVLLYKGDCNTNVQCM